MCMLPKKEEEKAIEGINTIIYKGKEFKGVNIPDNEFFESPRAVDIMIIFKSRHQKSEFLELVDGNKQPGPCKIGPFNFANCYFYSVTDSARCVKGHLEKKILAECNPDELTDYERELLDRTTAPDDTSDDALDYGVTDITKPKQPPF